MVYPLSESWNETLKKSEEAMKKVEDFYTRDEPMTEIDKVRGVEHAYYDEKAMKEAEECLSKLEACMEEEGRRGGDTGSPIHGATNAPPDYPVERMTPRARELYNKFKDIKTEEGSDGYVSQECLELDHPACDVETGCTCECHDSEHGWTKGQEKGEEEARMPCPKCGRKLPLDPEKRTRHITQHQADEGEFKPKPTELSDPEYVPNEEEEAPLDASAVKQSLNDALEEAANLVSGIEGFMTDIEELDMDDIDETVEVVNSILQALKDAKQMGFPSPTDSPEPQTKKPTPTPEKEPKPKEKEPEKGEA